MTEVMRSTERRLASNSVRMIDHITNVLATLRRRLERYVDVPPSRRYPFDAPTDMPDDFRAAVEAEARAMPRWQPPVRI